MLPLRLFRSRAFAAANVVSMLMTFGMFGSIFLLAQFFQVVQGYSPLEAGLRTLPWTFMPVVVAPLAGLVSTRTGTRPLLVLGMALQAIALGWMAILVTPTVEYLTLVPAFILAGAGMGLFFAPIANVVLSAVRPEEEGKASGANNAIRELGGVFGVAVLAAVFTANGSYAVGDRRSSTGSSRRCRSAPSSSAWAPWPPWPCRGGCHRPAHVPSRWSASAERRWPRRSDPRATHPVGSSHVGPTGALHQPQTDARAVAPVAELPILDRMVSYTLNEDAVANIRRLIDARQYILDSDWGEVQPRAVDENAYLAKHSWDEYAAWHLGLTDGANDETKARHAFVAGDFRRVHRSAIIACHFRAAEWRHKAIELAAHELLQDLDRKSGLMGRTSG